MTAALDLAPAGSGLATLVAQVHELLDHTAGVEVAGDPGPLVADLDRAVSRLSALKLRVLASAGADQAARASGATDTGSWAARLTRADGAAAQREVRLARDLHAKPSQRAATRIALDAGTITPAHAAIITRADTDLPRHLSPEQRGRIEQALVQKATRLTPTQLRRHATRALEAIEPDPAVVDAHENTLVHDEEQRAYAASRLTLHDNTDGTTTLHATVPRLHGDLLRKLLDTMTAPRRAKLGASAAHAGTSDELRDPAHARGLALCELLEHTPTDRLSGKTNATVVVTLDETVLRGAVRAAGLDTAHAISAGEARRLACGAGMIPAVLGGESLPLDLGRTKRLHTEAQRTALATVHTHCAAEGCERPFAWCELHHRVPWSRGGRTDLRHAVPLCWFHHRRIHDPEYEHRWRSDGTVAFLRVDRR